MCQQSAHLCRSDRPEPADQAWPGGSAPRLLRGRQSYHPVQPDRHLLRPRPLRTSQSTARQAAHCRGAAATATTPWSRRQSPQSGPRPHPLQSPVTFVAPHALCLLGMPVSALGFTRLPVQALIRPASRRRYLITTIASCTPRTVAPFCPHGRKKLVLGGNGVICRPQKPNISAGRNPISPEPDPSTSNVNQRDGGFADYRSGIDPASIRLGQDTAGFPAGLHPVSDRR